MVWASHHILSAWINEGNLPRWTQAVLSAHDGTELLVVNSCGASQERATTVCSKLKVMHRDPTLTDLPQFIGQQDLLHVFQPLLGKSF